MTSKCIKAVYLNDLLTHFYLRNSSEIDILYPLSHLNAMLRLATEQSVPNLNPLAKFKIGQKRPWTEKINNTINRCRLEWLEWS